ncbi:ArsC family reductase [Aliivibrio fischeri]|uniref:ArsC family reductase n=1 Tax=Aliivibrio fischeri TaxID=668 RepID=UPI0018C5B71E|nr:ArsC family reductase [Aliivibrio fischeri]
MTTIYGIKNCDTIKKCKKWLEANNINFAYHDYRTDGIDKEMVITFVKQLGWENVLNKRGTTYRQLSDEQKASLNEDTAIELLLEMPAMIKRPVLIHNNEYHLGFKPAQYETLFDI